MPRPNTLLFQKITHNGRELDVSFLREASFVEALDVSGPRLMLSFLDLWSLLKDDYRIKARDELTASIDDSYHSMFKFSN